jgi:hypothetical protein
MLSRGFLAIIVHAAALFVPQGNQAFRWNCSFGLFRQVASELRSKAPV